MMSLGEEEEERRTASSGRVPWVETARERATEAEERAARARVKKCIAVQEDAESVLRREREKVS